MSGSGLYGSDTGGGNTRRAATAELIGTFLLVFTGTAVAVSAATGRTIAGQPSNSLAVALAFGLVLVALVSALGHVSGAHGRGCAWPNRQMILASSVALPGGRRESKRCDGTGTVGDGKRPAPGRKRVINVAWAQLGPC